MDGADAHRAHVLLHVGLCLELWLQGPGSLMSHFD